MSNTIEAEDLIKLAVHVANTKGIITFEELNAILFPCKWKEVEKLLYAAEARRAALNSDCDCYCD